MESSRRQLTLRLARARADGRAQGSEQVTEPRGEAVRDQGVQGSVGVRPVREPAMDVREREHCGVSVEQDLEESALVCVGFDLAHAPTTGEVCSHATRTTQCRPVGHRAHRENRCSAVPCRREHRDSKG